jgi:hypothetical protein
MIEDSVREVLPRDARSFQAHSDCSNPHPQYGRPSCVQSLCDGCWALPRKELRSGGLRLVPLGQRPPAKVMLLSAGHVCEAGRASRLGDQHNAWGPSQVTSVGFSKQMERLGDPQTARANRRRAEQARRQGRKYRPAIKSTIRHLCDN